MEASQLTSKSDVYNVIRNMAISYDFKPGERINEVQLAKQLGVSRTPLREAMQKLVSEKLLRWERNKGFFCHMLNEKEVFNLFEFRKIIEEQAAYLSVKRATDDELLAVKKIALEYSNISNDVSKEKLIAMDQQIHESMVALSGNHELLSTLRQINQRIYFIRWVNIANRPTDNHTDHLDYIDALLERNAEKAVSIISQHIERRQEQIAEFIREGYGMIYTDNRPKIVEINDIAF
ncbi:GntR family transcriptional regulator [Marinomonas sp. S3726]|uniref:GntR family transcriptional regulator n=1 Tax=Marinomonas sp. S3726 TaxID=579484 RepID=UPI0005FA1DE4|nr:GntR family transcriptional regulator [Marinomonas sp. S3726]